MRMYEAWVSLFFYINGRRASDAELEPGWTDYRKYIEYCHYDIKAFLHAGRNTVGAEIANGWYIKDDAGGYTFHFPSFMPASGAPYKPYGRYLIFGMTALGRVLEKESAQSLP